MFQPSRLIPALALVVISSCASGTGGTTSGTRGPRNVLTQAQMLETGTSSVSDAIRRLRSSWLRTRGGNAQIVVYMDNVRLGDGTLDQLSRISITRATSVRLISPSDATTRWGTGHSAGVIEILTR